jgi:hypothetical protein
VGLFGSCRTITSGEKSLAQQVFQHYLPYDKIQVGSSTGIGGAPWTQYTYDRYVLHLARRLTRTRHRWRRCQALAASARSSSTS